MYATPIVYPVSQLSANAAKLIMLNPVASSVELFRSILLGSGTLPFSYWGYSWIVTIVCLALGIVLFSRIEKTFMDTV